jgi:hypothetical protein
MVTLAYASRRICWSSSRLSTLRKTRPSENTARSAFGPHCQCGYVIYEAEIDPEKLMIRLARALACRMVVTHCRRRLAFEEHVEQVACRSRQPVDN